MTRRLALCSFLVLVAATPAAAQCTQTLSAGANVASAAGAAAAGSTICLNSGSYGSVALSAVTKSPRVTIRSVTAQGASFSLSTTNGANGFTFDSVTLTGWDLSGSTTKNITISNTRFTGQASMSLCGVINANVLLDTVTFIDITVGASAGEGRLHISQPGCLGTQAIGVTVKNSTFENTGTGTVGESDGIQVGSNGAVIGPGNIFRGIRQNGFARHIDAIQGYGQSDTVITGNYFENNTVNVGMYDGGRRETITNNAFNTPSGTGEHLQLSGISQMTFTHNTFRNTTISHSSKIELTANNNWLVRDNIFVNSDLKFGSGQQVCNVCTYDRNLFDAQSTQWGSNNVLGSPTFTGGATPTTWAGFQLTTTSLGYRAASDGADMGTLFYGGAIVGTVPAAPTAVRVVP